MKRTGTFYGIGVGPGDPELMTLKAKRVLDESKVIAVPRSPDSSSDGTSQALVIISRIVDLNGKEIRELLLPMTKDKAVLTEARRKAAGVIARELQEGRDVAFVTLGDPMLYSTFSYLIPFVREEMPEAAISVIPGVTSFSAAASRAGIALAESDEKVIIIPAAYDTDEVERLLSSDFDTMVLMKVNRNFEKIHEAISGAGLLEKALFVSRAGWPGEEITEDLASLRGRKLDYFSIIIIKKGR